MFRNLVPEMVVFVKDIEQGKCASWLASSSVCIEECNVGIYGFFSGWIQHGGVLSTYIHTLPTLPFRYIRESYLSL